MKPRESIQIRDSSPNGATAEISHNPFPSPIQGIIALPSPSSAPEKKIKKFFSLEIIFWENAPRSKKNHFVVPANLFDIFKGDAIVWQNRWSRHVFSNKKTKTTPVMQLVKTVRQKDGRLQQKLVVSLGQKFVPENLRKTVAVHVENRLNGYQPLYPLALEEAEWVDYILQRYGNAVPETPASKRSGSDFEQEKSFPEITLLESWRRISRRFECYEQATCW